MNEKHNKERKYGGTRESIVKYNKKRLSDTCILLHYPKYVFFCVETICVPAYAADGAFFHSNFAAVFLYLTQVFIDVRDIYCADISTYRSVRSRFFSLPFH